MSRAILFVVLGAILCGMVSEAPARHEHLNDDQRFTILTSPTDDELDSDKTREIHLERFRSLWSERDYSAGLAEVSDEAINLRIRAASSTAQAGLDGWVLERYRAALDEAQRRGIARSDNVRELFDAYLAAFLWKRAENLGQSYTEFDLPAVPEIVQMESPMSDSALKLWRIVDNPIRLEAFPVELSGPRLVVVSSPGCAFCRRAATSLSSDNILGPLMQEHAIWLSEKSLNHTYLRLMQFNRDIPQAQHYFVDDPSQWPVPEFNLFPQFLFIVDGEVRQTLIGWPGGTEVFWAIARGFESIGLLNTGMLEADAFAYADGFQSNSNYCPTRQEAWAEIIETTPINNREDLEAHLAEMSNGGTSPLLVLSQEARKRLADSVHFGDRSVIGFRLDDIRTQLDQQEIHDVAKLFGLQVFYAGTFFPVEILSKEDRELKARFECTGDYAHQSR